MLVRLSWPAALAVDVAVLVAWSAAAGGWTAHRPLDALDGHGWLLRLRRFEAGGDWYERWWRVRAWKDHLPEAGTWFGGLSKRHLPPADQGGLDRYRAECVRAELTHWLALAPLPVLAIWTPAWLFACLAVGGLTSNGPCIVAPRYNRARIDALRGRRARRAPPARPHAATDRPQPGRA